MNLIAAALVCAALLVGCEYELPRFRVTLYDEEGRLVREWEAVGTVTANRGTLGWGAQGVFSFRNVHGREVDVVVGSGSLIVEALPRG